ncbi:hypothetical protein HG531_011685 [Fusarium graminearum]|nr:hypothetical protein HG531_011685 [Fusarium graminearum]
MIIYITHFPKLSAHRHALLQKALSESHDIDVNVIAADGGTLLGSQLSLGNREDSVDAERNTDTRNLALAREHADEVVVSASSSHTSNANSGVIRAVIILSALLALLLGRLGIRILLTGGNFGGRTLSDNLVDEAGVVVKTSSQTEVKRNPVQAVESLEVFKKKFKILHTLLHGLVGGQTLCALQLLEQILLALQDNPLSNSVSDLAVESLFLGHFLAHISPGQLVELVDSRGDGADLVFRHAADLEDTVEDLPVIQLYRVSTVPAKPLKDFCDDAENLGVGQHGVVGSSNVEIALVEFSHTALGHGGLISTVDLGNVVSLDVLDLLVHGEEAGEGDGQVISQGADLTTLVGEIVDELAVLSIFAGENLSKLEDRGINCDSAVALENLGNGVEDVITNDHILSLPLVDVRIEIL